MKERKTSKVTGQKQIIIASCLMLILVTCLTGLYIAKRMEQPNRETQIAENNEKTKLRLAMHKRTVMMSGCVNDSD